MEPPPLVQQAEGFVKPYLLLVVESLAVLSRTWLTPRRPREDLEEVALVVAVLAVSWATARARRVPSCAVRKNFGGEVVSEGEQ